MIKLYAEFRELMEQLTPLQQAETVLPIFEDKYPFCRAPRNAIEAAKVDKLTEKLIDSVNKSRDVTEAASVGDLTSACYAVYACRCVLRGWNCFASVVENHASHAFSRTTDELRLKVIEVGKDILKRDNKEIK